jgi:hypothetical protein
MVNSRVNRHVNLMPHMHTSNPAQVFCSYL